MRWRWDQGRLPYYKYENIRSIATVLNSLDGISLATRDDMLRYPLVNSTELPFAPSHYKVWRNYARVFQCAMLATSIDNKLIVSELCQNLASSNALSSDEYLNFVFSHFQYPYPAFDDYNIEQNRVFPFIALIKFLVSRNGESVSLNDVFEYVIGNNCTGLESVNHYRRLPKTSRKAIGDEYRQVREMLVFMSQVSYIRWFDSRLYIDTNEYDTVLSTLIPYTTTNRDPDSSKEFLNITSLSRFAKKHIIDIVLKERGVSEFSVKEGRKNFDSHQKIERSPLIRDRYFKAHPIYVCDACGITPVVKYPWLKDVNILELHHILPLSATLNINGTTTTMDDLKPLCPNCHRSIHVFYKNKLNEWDIPDFSSKKMALDVYELAKKSIA